MSGPSAEAVKPAAPKKSKLVPVLIGVIVLLLAGGGAGAYFLVLAPKPAGAHPAAHAEEEGEGEEEGEEHAEEEGEGEEGEEGEGEGEEEEEGDEGHSKRRRRHNVGPLLEVDSVVVNLNEPGAGRYLKATLNFELRREEDKEHVEKMIIPIRDAVVTYLSGLRVVDLEGIEKRNALRDVIRTEVNALLGKPRVRHIYFTELLVQ